MKRVFKTRATASQAVNGKSSKWAATSAAAQSTPEIIARSRAAVKDAIITVEDARISIAESSALATGFNIWRRRR